LLTTSLEPFADIRRRRDSTFGKFPSAEDFAEMRLKATAPMAPRDGRKTVRYARNPWDPPVPEAYYEVRFSPPRSFTYEGLGSTAAKADAGVTTTHRCSSLMEANALARRVLGQMPTLAIATFKVSSDSVRLLDAAARAPVAEAEDAWVGDYSDVVANAAAGVASPVGGNDLCGNQPVRRVHDNSSLSHFSAMTRSVMNRHCHAIEQASRRWRGGRTRRKIIISTQATRTAKRCGTTCCRIWRSAKPPPRARTSTSSGPPT
jgi:hypothetical protein